MPPEWTEEDEAREWTEEEAPPPSISRVRPMRTSSSSSMPPEWTEEYPPPSAAVKSLLIGEYVIMLNIHDSSIQTSRPEMDGADF